MIKEVRLLPGLINLAFWAPGQPFSYNLEPNKLEITIMNTLAWSFLSGVQQTCIKLSPDEDSFLLAFEFLYF